MSDIDSMAATRATPPSAVTSSHASPEPLQDTSTSHPRSPSPGGWNSKRRRVDSAFPEMHGNPIDFNHHDNLTNNLSPPPTPQSAPDLPLFFDSTGSFELQPRTFMGHDREFMSHILSTRGVTHLARATIRHRSHIPRHRFRAENRPVVSADNASFVGWMEKADTWPAEKGHHVQRSFTFPQ